MNITDIMAAGGVKYTETCFTPGNVPPLPYALYLDEEKALGCDFTNNAKKHSYVVEYYSETRERFTALESYLDTHGVKYTKGEQQWDSENECFMTPYYFDFIERGV